MSTQPIKTLLSANGLKWAVGGKTIVDVDSFSLGKGEIVALAGPNGAGKSSLLKLLAVLIKPNRGDILLDGQNAWDNPLASRRCTSFIFQDPLLLKGNVLENVYLGLKLRGVKKHDAYPQVREWLNRLGIEGLARRNVRTLSGGEAQRVSIARALVTRPQILFMDEPFSYLDSPTKSALISDLAGIIGESGTSAVFVTHDALEIPPLADRVCVMAEGRILQSAPPREVFHCPANPEVARILGIDSILAAVDCLK